MQCPRRGHLDWQWRCARGISAERIGNEGSRAEQPECPKFRSRSPHLLAETRLPREADGKRHREQACNDEVGGLVRITSRKHGVHPVLDPRGRVRGRVPASMIVQSIGCSLGRSHSQLGEDIRAT
jgi:hypothetical protein